MPKYNILVIDKDPKALFTTSRILENNRFNVTLALNGTSAIDAISDTDFAIILTEFSLQDTKGLAILEATRKVNPDTMLIFQTASIDPAFREETFKLGADDYLFKPYESEELLFRVQKNLERYELKQKLKLQGRLVAGCCVCKKIRFDEKGPASDGWVEIEDFLKEKMNVLLSSTYCPECAQTIQEDLLAQMDRLKAAKVSRSF